MRTVSLLTGGGEYLRIWECRSTNLKPHCVVRWRDGQRGDTAGLFLSEVFSQWGLTKTWEVRRLFTFCRWENWGLKKWSNAHEVTHKRAVQSSCKAGLQNFKGVYAQHQAQLPRVGSETGVEVSWPLDCSSAVLLPEPIVLVLELLNSPNSWERQKKQLHGWVGSAVSFWGVLGAQTAGHSSNTSKDFETSYSSAKNTSCWKYLL